MAKQNPETKRKISLKNIYFQFLYLIKKPSHKIQKSFLGQHSMNWPQQKTGEMLNTGII